MCQSHSCCEEPSHPIVQPHRGRSSLLTRQTTRQKSLPDVSRWCVLHILIYEWSVLVTCMCANTTDTNTRPQIHDHSHRYRTTATDTRPHRYTTTDTDTRPRIHDHSHGDTTTATDTRPQIHDHSHRHTTTATDTRPRWCCAHANGMCVLCECDVCAVRMGCIKLHLSPARLQHGAESVTRLLVSMDTMPY
jgi:hypothetical protein